LRSAAGAPAEGTGEVAGGGDLNVSLAEFHSKSSVINVTNQPGTTPFVSGAQRPFLPHSIILKHHGMPCAGGLFVVVGKTLHELP
jgi:hypothetical protein